MFAKLESGLNSVMLAKLLYQCHRDYTVLNIGEQKCWTDLPSDTRMVWINIAEKTLSTLLHSNLVR